MQAFNWLKRLRRSERGNIMVVGAASMPLLIGSAALAVDTIQLSLWKRQLQRAADSGAVAGAHAFGQGAAQGSAVENDLDEHIDSDLAENETPTLTNILVQTGSFGEQALSSAPCADRGVDPCFGRAVQVSLTAQRSLPFLGIFSSTPTIFTAQATAALVDEGQYCLISLYAGDDPGITAGGNANVTLGCGMATNSRADSAVTAGGSSQITATPIAAVGGLDGSGQNFVGNTTLQPYSAPQEDPLAWVPDPTPLDISDCGEAMDIGPQFSGSKSPKCYSSMDIKGTVTLNPGTYFVTGDVTFNSQAVVNGTGVTIVLTGLNGAAGNMHINGGAQLNLSAPSSGAYKGVVLYRDRRASEQTVKFNGGAGLNLTGALYFPTTNIETMGNFDLTSQCLQLVAYKVDFKGSASITNNCPSNSGSGPFARPVVRLVG